MSDNPQNNNFGKGSISSIASSFLHRKSDSAPASSSASTSTSSSFNRTLSVSPTSTASSLGNRSFGGAGTATPGAGTASTLATRQSGNAIASVMRKTSTPNRAQFTPSTYPGITNLAIASQKAGYDSVSARNPDIQPTTQDRLQVQSRTVSDAQYKRFAQYIEDQSGIVLGDNKHYLVNSRLSSLLLRFKVSTIDELINRAMQPNIYKDISSAVIDAMTPVRIWSAACSSGQEPYSIAMIVQEQVTNMVHVDPNQCQIIGTDISPEMLDRCRFAHYDNHALARGLSAERKARFFKPTKDPNVMRVDDKIKQMVTFKQMNLLGSYSLLGRFDVIFCRNVLIYFSNDVKSQILNKFSLCLNPGGYLILGSSESIQGLSDKYEMVRCNPGLAYRLKA